MTKKIVLYVFHELNEQAKFFLETGIFKNINTDFFLILQGLSKNLLESYSCTKYENVTIIERENIGRDFGGWSHVILNVIDYKKYDYFIFINASCRGPFLPGYIKREEWVDIMIRKINDDIKLVGPSIGAYDCYFHVQSYCFATDKIGLKILIDKKIIVNEYPTLTYDIIIDQEVRMSHEILTSGYNIACFLTCLNGIDFRHGGIRNVNPFWDPTTISHNHYFGFSYQPPEVLFYKLRNGHNKNMLDIYSRAVKKDMSIYNIIPPYFHEYFTNGGFYQEYRELNPDLKHLPDKSLLDHFKNTGIGNKENRPFQEGIYQLCFHDKPIDKYYDDLSPRLQFFKLIWKHLYRKKCLEIGGPSSLTFQEITPVYKTIGCLDILNFSDITVWSQYKHGGTLQYFRNKTATTLISDGNDLSNIADESYEVLLASHVFEHIANPLRALKNWIRVLKPEGILLLILPKKDTTFDHKRPITKFSTLEDKYKRNVGEDDLSSLDEILTLHDLSRDPAAPQDPQKFKERCLKNKENRCLHHHVFDYDLLYEIGDYFKLTYLGEYCHRNHDQYIMFRK